MLKIVWMLENKGFAANIQLWLSFKSFCVKCIKNFDENVEQVVVYLNFCKAFDSVDHTYLLVKLINFGFDENFVVLIPSSLEVRN